MLLYTVYTYTYPPHITNKNMYAEEYLYDDAHDYDNSDVSIEETSSMDTEQRIYTKNIQLHKQKDQDYYSFKRVEMDFEGNSCLKKVDVYSTPMQGVIRNATTGIREKNRVGSNLEDLYFTVKDVSAFTKMDKNKEPRKLFYRSPEEFERHFKLELSQSIKEKWHNKYLLALKQME